MQVWLEGAAGVGLVDGRGGVRGENQGGLVGPHGGVWLVSEVALDLDIDLRRGGECHRCPGWRGWAGCWWGRG